VPVLTLAGIIVVSVALALGVAPEHPLPLILAFSLIGLLIWVFWMGGGWRMAEKDAVVIMEDFTRRPSDIRQGTYLFIPIIHTIEAKMPSYPLRHEFSVDSIDTRTPNLQQIKKIKVRLLYEIVDFRACFRRSADMKERIKQLESSEKFKRDDPSLWTRLLNEVMHGVIDDSIREGVWKWAESLAKDSDLKLDMPTLPEPLKVEHDAYALSLNRVKLADKVLEEVRFRSREWGLRVHRIVFENIELDPDMIKGKTRNKDRELEEATHDAKKAAIAIREKGMAEAEVRAATVAKIIELLMSHQERLSLNDQMLYNIVRAAMYSDGQMIWGATMEKPSASGNASVKAA
jgi:hypothetical protein